MKSTKSVKAGTVDEAASKIAAQRNLNVETVRKAIVDAIKLGNLDNRFGFLTFNGILPVTLPDGCKIAILPDIHCPAHHRKIWWAVKAWLKEYKPDIVILIGDVADVFALSAWPKLPRAVSNMQMELDETRRLLDEIIEVSGCYHMFVIMGNHEDRVIRFLTNVAPQVASILDYSTREPIMSLHGLLGFKPGDPITFIYDASERGGFGGGIRINDDITFHHGFIVRPAPGASPRADADRFGQSTGHGHTHRLGMNARETTNEDVIVAAEFGNLVDPQHSFMAYANLLNNWHPGLGVGTVENGRVHLQPIPIKPVVIDGQLKYVFTFAGKTYVQSDR